MASNLTCALATFVVIMLALTFIGSIFGISQGKFTLEYWLTKFDESRFDLDLGQIINSKLVIDGDWGIFDFFREFINSIVGIFSVAVSLAQFVTELVRFGFSLFFNIYT